MKKFIRNIFIFLLLIIITIGGYFTYEGYDLYKKALNEISVEEKKEQIKSEKENYTKIEELPKDYINAVIAVEDRRFYTHNGIDLISIGRAVLKDIKEMKLVEGGSTITQQLVKNITNNRCELMGVLAALKYFDSPETMEIYSDSQYVVNSINQN